MASKLYRHYAFVCDCGDLSHTFIVTETEDNRYIHILIEHETLIDRIKTAWSLIRKRHRKYGDFGEILIREADIGWFLNALHPKNGMWDPETDMIEREDVDLHISDEQDIEDMHFGYGLIALVKPSGLYDENDEDSSQLVVYMEYDRDKSFWSRAKMVWNHLIHGKPSKRMGQWAEFTLNSNDEQCLFDILESVQHRQNTKAKDEEVQW